MSKNLQKSNIMKQMPNYDENKQEKVMQYNYGSSKIVISDLNIIENEIEILDYTADKNEYHHILMKNAKCPQNKLINIRQIISKNFDDIFNRLERFKEELFIKDLKFSQLMDDMHLIKAENEEKNVIIQMLQENYSEFSNDLVGVNINSTFDDSQKKEIYEGKLLIIEQIKQLNGHCNAEAENYRLSDLINMLLMAIFDKEVQLEILNTNSVHSIQEQNLQLVKEIDDHKEWQKHLEHENEKLNFEIELYKRKQNILLNKENEHNDLKEDNLKIQFLYDELSKEKTYLMRLVNECQNRLTEKELKCEDSNNLIKILKSNLAEQVDKTEQANSYYNNEKEKCQRIESHIQQMIEEFTIQIHGKNIELQSILDECCSLKDHISSADAEIENLKHSIITLDYVIGEKNKIIQDLIKCKNKQEFITSSSKFNELIQNLNNLNQQMDIILGGLCTYERRIINYENMLCNMQNTIQTQYKIKKYLKTKQKNFKYIKRIKYQKFSKKLIKEKEIISLNYQKEIDIFKMETNNLIKQYNLKITRLVNDEIKLKDEIQHLKEELKLKSSHIIMTEKIANLQLKEAYNVIQRLTEASITEVCNKTSFEFNEMKNSNSEMHHYVTHVSTAINNTFTDSKFQKIECLINLMQKLKLEKKILQKVCQMREEKIKYLKGCHYSCLTAKNKFNNF